MKRAGVILLLLAAVAVGVAGCGGGNGNGESADGERLSKAEYEAELALLAGAVSEGFASLGNLETPEDLEARAEQAQMDLNNLTDQLEAVSPPEDIENLHEDLVAGLRQFSVELNELSSSVIEAVETEDVPDPLEILSQLASLESVAIIRGVLAELEGKGYVTGLEDAE